MSNRNRFLRILVLDLEDRNWKRLSNICNDCRNNNLNENKIILEQKLLNTGLKSKVNFNKIVEVFEYPKGVSYNSTRLNELASIANGFKKDCGLIESEIKQSRNRFRIFESKSESAKLNILNTESKNEINYLSVRPLSQASNSGKLKHINDAIKFSKKLNSNTATFVNLKIKIRLK